MLPTLIACAEPAPPALILLAMDNVRWDRTDLAGTQRRLTPALARLAALDGAVTYTRAYSAAPFSLASYTSLFTGRDLPEHGVAERTWTVPDSASTLAEAFEANGWDTAAFVGGAQLASQSNLGQGFDVYVEGGSLAPFAVQADNALQWLDAQPRQAPFFLFVHGYDAHIPYLSQQLLTEHYDPGYHGPIHGVRELLTSKGIAQVLDATYTGPGETIALADADLDHIIAHYHSAVRTSDYHVGRFLHEIERRGILDRALIVALSDHGEELGERGVFGHGPELRDATLHVPLVIRLPDDTRPARVYDGLVSETDVPNTVLEHFGIAPLGESDGELLPFDGPARPGRVLRVASDCCRGARDSDWLLASDMHAAWGLFRNGEGEDQSAAHPDEVERLKRVIAHWPAPGNLPVEPPTEAFEQKLREAGYFRTP